MKARPLMAGYFRMGQISCCKPNPAIGGYTCYDKNGTPVWNAAGHAGPIPNPCPEGGGGEPPPANQPPIGINPPPPPPTGNDCPPGQFRPAPGQPCRGSVGTMPGGGTDLVPNPPGGGQQSTPTPPTSPGNGVYQVQNCSVPQQYKPLPTGGAGPGGAVFACPRGDGTFNVISTASMAPVMSGISQDCLNQFGDVTMKRADEAPCGGPQQAPPAQGSCTIPTDEAVIMCPPSNGITANYFLPGRTAAYIKDFTTQPPDCANQSNVIKVGPNSPYCGGSSVQGAGDGYPTMVACHLSPGNVHGENLVQLHGPNFEVLEQQIMLKDIETKYPGQRYLYVTQPFCSPLPTFPNAPAAAPMPAPAPAPPASVISTPGAQPLTYPIQNMWFPESLEPPPIQPVSGGPMAPFQPFPAYQPPPPPPAPASIPTRPIYGPGQPIPVTDWFGICVDKSRGR